jgi:hypothetical protein
VRVRLSLILLLLVLTCAVRGQLLGGPATAVGQTACGTWDGTKPADTRFSIDAVRKGSGADCQGSFTFANGTKILGFGGYSLELTLGSTTNAGTSWVGNGNTTSALLTPLLDVELLAQPQDETATASVPVSAALTLKAEVFDTSIFLLRGLIDFIPAASCAIPQETIVTVAVQVGSTLNVVAQRAIKLDIVGAQAELKQVFGHFVQDALDGLKEAGIGCAAQFLGEVVIPGAKQTEAIAKISFDFATWVPVALWHELKYHGKPSQLTLNYTAAPQSPQVNRAPTPIAAPPTQSSTPSTRATEPPTEESRAFAAALQELGAVQVGSPAECLQRQQIGKPCIIQPPAQAARVAHGLYQFGAIVADRLGNIDSQGELLLGRDQNGGWRFWYGRQQGTPDIDDLPADLVVCSGGDSLNLRATPGKDAPVAGRLPDGTRIQADQFVLTEPGNWASHTSGAGWFHITAPQAGWVYSLYTSRTDNGFADCRARNAQNAAFATPSPTTSAPTSGDPDCKNPAIVACISTTTPSGRSILQPMDWMFASINRANESYVEAVRSLNTAVLSPYWSDAALNDTVNDIETLRAQNEYEEARLVDIRVVDQDYDQYLYGGWAFGRMAHVHTIEHWIIVTRSKSGAAVRTDDAWYDNQYYLLVRGQGGGPYTIYKAVTTPASAPPR